MSDLDWQLFLANSIKQAKKVTKFRDPKNRKWAFAESPNYRVFETSPSQKLDKGKTYLISGSEATIMLQASLIKASHDILGQRLGYTIDFDQWFEDFSLEFKKNPVTGEYREGITVSSTTDEQALKYWGVPYAERPKFKWIEPSPTATDKQLEDFNKLGYSVIKFWKNRSLDDEWVFLSGTLTEIRQQLVDAMRAVNIEDSYIGNSTITESQLLSGFPEIKVKFWQTQKMGDTNYRNDTILTITLIGYGECLEDNQPKLLDLNDLKLFRDRIINLYYPGNIPFILKRGKETYTYQDWKKGYATYTHFLNEENALAVYERLVQIKGDTLDDTKIGIGTKKNNSQFGTNKKIIVLDKEVKSRNYRPVVDLQFWQAWVWLPKSTKKIMLFNRGRGLPCDPMLVD